MIAHDEIQIRGCSSESRFKRYESKIERAYEQGNTLKKEKFNLKESSRRSSLCG